MGTESLAQHSSGVKRQEEQLLVDRCRRGDRESFAQLMRLHEKQIYNFTYRMLGNEGEAEDLTQDIFIAAFRGIRSFRGEAKFSTWLYRIALKEEIFLPDRREEQIMEQTRGRKVQRDWPIVLLLQNNGRWRKTWPPKCRNASTKYQPRPDRYWYCGMYRVFPMTN
jgi:hypothetical protein